MAIWAIADIHASQTNPETGLPSKPMAVFGTTWENHFQRIAAAWQQDVQDTDTVIVAGDIDWALHLNDAMETLHRIASWPGRKILLRGNHDYWWSSKTTGKVRRALPPGIELLHNNAFQVEGFNICGAKGSPVPGGIDWTPQNEKLLHREVQRLQLSLAARDPDLPTIVALHYPPFYRAHDGSPYRAILDEYQVRACVYGHLHGEAGRSGPEGRYGPTVYKLVAADATGFRPVIVARRGEIVLPPRCAGDASSEKQTRVTMQGTSDD